MPFEPQFPEAFSGYFHGHMQCTVTDPHGIPATTIISMQDDWHLNVNWQVHGTLVPSLCGTWQLRAYLESIGPGPEILVAQRDVKMDGSTNYSEVFFIGPNMPPREGPYKLVTVITSRNIKGGPAPFAGYDEGPILQFFEGPSLES